METQFTVLETKEISLKNVVGIVKGTDPELSDQFITVGAHLDHVAYPTGEVANGADDDASGSAGVMEIAEAVAKNPPRCSVVFIAEINDETIQYPLIFDFDHRHSGSSDHASYHDAGIPAFFFFSGEHEDLHKPGDDAAKIEYDKAVKISRLAYLITMKLANMDEVPDFLE